MNRRTKAYLIVLFLGGVFIFNMSSILEKIEVWRHHKVVTLILKQRMTPGRYNYESGQLISNSNGSVEIIHLTPNLIIFHKGGGHRKSRGLVYFEEVSTVDALKSSFSDGIAFEKIKQNWWKFYSREE